MIQDDSVKIDRKRLVIKPNAIVGYKGNKYKIINILNEKRTTHFLYLFNVLHQNSMSKKHYASSRLFK